jgi:hypothetical protein
MDINVTNFLISMGWKTIKTSNVEPNSIIFELHNHLQVRHLLIHLSVDEGSWGSG